MPEYKTADLETLRGHIAGTLLEVLFDHWSARCEELGRVPAQGEIDPAAMKPALQNLVIANFDEDRDDYHVRLAGSSVREMLKLELTGRYLKDIYDAGFAAKLVQQYHEVRLTRRPHLMRLVAALDSRKPYCFHRLLLPLEGDAVIGCGYVQTHIDHLDTSLVEMARKRTSLSGYLVNLN